MDLKTYRTARVLISEIGQALAKKAPPANYSPLEKVVELLCHGRHYTWVGIYLTAGSNSAKSLLGAGGEPHPAQITLPGTQSKLLISMKLAGREIGILSAESDRQYAFGSVDRVLLERTAAILALFLTGKGKYIVQKARTAVAA